MTLPLIVDPEAFVQRLDDDQLVIVDVGKLALYQQAHIPGARFLDYGHLVANSGRTHGLLPDRGHLEALFSSLGITRETHVVACDDEGGGKAARLVWTLHCAGHDKASLLNGGLHTWLNEGFPHTPETGTIEPARFEYHENPAPVISGDEILERIDDSRLQLLDARSLAEYNGEYGATISDLTDKIGKMDIQGPASAKPATAMVMIMVTKRTTPRYGLPCQR